MERDAHDRPHAHGRGELFRDDVVELAVDGGNVDRDASD
jgi:hypothetical protein